MKLKFRKLALECRSQQSGGTVTLGTFDSKKTIGGWGRSVRTMARIEWRRFFISISMIKEKEATSRL